MSKAKDKPKVDELFQVSVPTKKIILTISEDEKIEIILRPFKHGHFTEAIFIINNYFSAYNSVNENYLAERKAILEKYPTEEEKNTRENAIAIFEAGFKETEQIVKAILGSGEQNIAEDIKTVVSMSIFRSTRIITVSEEGGQESKERSPIDLDLDNLTWGENLILLGSSIGLNLDFFAQNSEAMNLMTITKNEVEPKPKPKDGEESSADSSKLVTATAK